MYTLQLHAPLCHHIARYRAVDAAGEQQCGLSAHTHRQSACAGLCRAMDKGPLLPNFHLDGIGRIVDIHLHLRIFLCQPSADLL